MPITQQANPTYFDDQVVLANQSQNSSHSILRNGHNHNHCLPPKPTSINRRRMDSSTSETEGISSETDVFINSSSDSSTDYRNYRNYPHSERFKRNGPLSASNSESKKESGTFGKITKFLQWTTKSSKSSVSSNNSENSSTLGSSSSSSGINSPTPTPPRDSTLSIYTNSLDSVDSQSHSSNSTKLSPFYNTNQDGDRDRDFAFSSLSYDDDDDCHRFAVNSYYNVGVGGTPGKTRPRINSSPLPLRKETEISHGGPGPSTYYNTNFLTFRSNPRRHSLAAPNNNNYNPTTARDGFGYLVPIQTKTTTGSFRRSTTPGNVYANDIELPSISSRPTNRTPKLNVEVDVHHSNQTSTTSFSTINNNKNQNQSSSNDSSSTLVLCESSNSQEGKIRNNNSIHTTSNRFNFSSASSLAGGGAGIGDSDCEKYCVLCTSSLGLTSPSYAGKSSKMEVAIVSCRECFFTQRAEGHIKKFFENILTSEGQKLDVILQTYDVKEIDHHTTAAQVHRSKVQIVIISHHFLERLKHESNVRKKVSPLNRVLRSKRVIAILLSVSEAEVLDGYQQFLLNFPEWHILELPSTSRLDLEFTRKFTEHVIRIYSTEQASLITPFTVFPKKITQDQSKVILLFKKPIESGDRVQVKLNRGRGKEQFLAQEVNHTNPYSLTVTIPAPFISEKTSLIEISPYINELKLGTKHVKYEHNNKEGANDEDMIQKMILAVPGFRKVLDDHISQQLSKSFRSSSDFTLEPSLELMNETLVSKVEILPTVMHFAAYYGLEQSVCILLYEADGLEQCGIRNEFSETPEDIAISRGFESTIGQIIKDFNEVSNTFGAYRYMKELYERHSEELEELTTANNDNNDYENEIFMKDSKETSTGLEESSPCIQVVVENSESEACVPQEEPLTVQTPENDSKLHVPIPNFRSISPDQKQTVESQNYANINFRINTESLKSEETSTRQVLPTYDIPPAQANPVKPGNTSNYYDMPRLIQQDYCIPPQEAKPVLPVKPPAPQLNGPVLVKTSDGILLNDPDGYIDVMNGSGGNTLLAPRTPTTKHHSNQQQNSKYPTVPTVAPTHAQGLSKLGFLNHTAGAGELTKQYSLCPTQEELLELMNDFKNNVYNMRELELLYGNWTQRLDVQRDFKVRQKELKEIQKEYKKIQDKIRKESKKPSPIERLMRLVPGSKKKISNAGMKLGVGSPILNAVEEPIRKISGSSDRCSSLSGGSLPDSGVSEPDSERTVSSDQRIVPNPSPIPSLTSTSSAYVGPSDLDNNIASLDSASVVSQSPSTPPPRPGKKISLSEETLVQNDTNGGINPNPSAPPPPPRKNSNSPFSYIDYKSRSKELHKFAPSAKSSPSKSKKYENDLKFSK